MPGHTRAQCTLGKMSRSQLPSQRYMHSAGHPHYCLRTTAGIHAAAGCSGLGVMYRFSNKNSEEMHPPSSPTGRYIQQGGGGNAVAGIGKKCGKMREKMRKMRPKMRWKMRFC